MNNKFEIENQLIDEIHQLSIDKIELVLKIVLSWKDQIGLLQETDKCVIKGNFKISNANIILK
jgi:hypothetical protein